MSARYPWRDLSDSELRSRLQQRGPSAMRWEVVEALVRNRDEGWAIERIEAVLNP